ncbi:hypothetical protein TRVA0_066S00188 [Trichomonascus vanleenenianus]|uniref:dolichol-phosphate mannosyltransferase subunit 3 n=1 Tax=Trichomonascus vanleenenianus TaxID=2268995 RepID=UPI003ECB3C64
MTRAGEAVNFFAVVAVIYAALYFGIIPTGKTIQNEIIPVLPFWALVTFGSYSLASLGWGVLTFKDKEAKYKELLLQIDQAKKELRAKGVDIDD